MEKEIKAATRFISLGGDHETDIQVGGNHELNVKVVGKIKTRDKRELQELRAIYDGLENGDSVKAALELLSKLHGK